MNPLTTHQKRVNRQIGFFTLIVVSHLLEHIAQGYQFFVLGWERKESLGLVGLAYPMLIHNEYLHYGHALFMVLGIAYLLPEIKMKALTCWYLALILSFYHHLEHFLLLIQSVSGKNFFNSPVPTSIGQLFVPRLELHLFYNVMIFIPMCIALYIHYKNERYTF